MRERDIVEMLRQIARPQVQANCVSLRVGFLDFTSGVKMVM